MFVDSSDVEKYKRFCKSLNREKGLPNLELDESILPVVHKRVALAMDIEHLEFSNTKKQKEKKSFKSMAEEADILLDE